MEQPKKPVRFTALHYLCGPRRANEPRRSTVINLLLLRMRRLPAWWYKYCEVQPAPAVRKAVHATRHAVRRGIGQLVRGVRPASTRCHYKTCPRKAVKQWWGKSMCAECFAQNETEQLVNRGEQTQPDAQPTMYRVTWRAGGQTIPTTEVYKK